MAQSIQKQEASYIEAYRRWKCN